MTSYEMAMAAARGKWRHLADREIADTGALALYLGGSADSFTGQLLNLIAKADHGNTARIKAGFPRHVHVYQLWSRADTPLTYAELSVLEDTIKP